MCLVVENILFFVVYFVMIIYLVNNIIQNWYYDVNFLLCKYVYKGYDVINIGILKLWLCKSM